MGKDDGESGFTLVEMLLVVVLLALATGLVMARADPDRNAVTLSARLGDYLRAVRALAIIEGRILTLGFDPGTGQISGPPALGGLELDARVTLDASQLPANSLSFQPDGSTGGGVLHIVPRGAAGAGSGAGYGLVVSPLTGAVTAQP